MGPGVVVRNGVTMAIKDGVGVVLRGGEIPGTILGLSMVIVLLRG